MEAHNHCVGCGKMLPSTQDICYRCLEASRLNDLVPREPFYTPIVENELGGVT